jgi:hypothetical protein
MTGGWRTLDALRPPGGLPFGGWDTIEAGGAPLMR